MIPEIVFVDDEKDLEQIFSLEFFDEIEANKLKVSFYSESQKFLDNLSHHDNLKVIILDINMPKLSGLDLAKEILSKIPNIPIAICSAYDEEMHSQEMNELGVRAYLNKPLDMEELRNFIQKYITI